jgi:hypothetical protein
MKQCVRKSAEFSVTNQVVNAVITRVYRVWKTLNLNNPMCYIIEYPCPNRGPSGQPADRYMDDYNGSAYNLCYLLYVKN